MNEFLFTSCTMKLWFGSFVLFGSLLGLIAAGVAVVVLWVEVLRLK